MNEKNILKYDTQDMRKLLVEFPNQVVDAVRIGENFSAPYRSSSIKNIVVTGLGGSAIGGDLLRSYLADELKIPFAVNRHYFLAKYVDKNSFVIVSSYSGNTEETIASHKEATKRGAKVLCISTNGETEKLARKYNQPYVKIPKGFPPRAALGYSFFPILVVLSKMRIIKSKDKDIAETIVLLKKKSKQYAMLNRQNLALILAHELYGKLPIVYSSADRLDVVNLRWRGQIAENSKMLAFGHVVPEMNHNELVGWKVLKKQMKNMLVVFLHDKGDYPRVKVRMDIMKEILQKFASRVIEVESEGGSLLARIFSLIYLGDWVSFYLAILNREDPTPVKVIDYLKNKLS